MLRLRYRTGNPFCRKCDRVYLFVYKNYLFDRYLYLMYLCSTKLLQKREMRKDIVIELSYKGFSRASDYS